jgi:hypothetical protein
MLVNLQLQLIPTADLMGLFTSPGKTLLPIHAQVRRYRTISRSIPAKSSIIWINLWWIDSSWLQLRLVHSWMSRTVQSW